jgi:RHS repeat-associated protein
LTKTYQDASDTTTTFSYDLRGNLTKRGGTEYYWDSQDHMTKVYDGWNTVQYKYDLMGRRVAKKKNSGNWRWYFYDGLKVIVEGNATNGKFYYTNSPAVIGGIITDGSSWFHYDRLGNVVAQTGSDGVPTAMYTMDAFGNVLQKGDSYYGYLPDSASNGGYHFTTKEYDADSLLYYFNAGWYDAGTGRFVSKDILVRKNAYEYARSNPVRFLDPDGHSVVIAETKPTDGGLCCRVVADIR